MYLLSLSVSERGADASRMPVLVPTVRSSIGNRFYVWLAGRGCGSRVPRAGRYRLGPLLELSDGGLAPHEISLLLLLPHLPHTQLDCRTTVRRSELLKIYSS